MNNWLFFWVNFLPFEFFTFLLLKDNCLFLYEWHCKIFWIKCNVPHLCNSEPSYLEWRISTHLPLWRIKYICMYIHTNVHIYRKIWASVHRSSASGSIYSKVRTFHYHFFICKSMNKSIFHCKVESYFNFIKFNFSLLNWLRWKWKIFQTKSSEGQYLNWSVQYRLMTFFVFCDLLFK